MTPAELRDLHGRAATIIAAEAKRRFEGCRTDDGPFMCGEYCDDLARCKAAHADLCEVAAKLAALA